MMRLPPEQQSILTKCFHPRGTFLEFPEEDVKTSIPARFEKIVEAHPDHLAIKTPEDELTYYELNNAANRVAHNLMNFETAESTPVALLFETGVQIIVAMLGVLKAGHFFVLLDPSLPKKKIAAVLAKSQARLVFTDQRNLQMARDVAVGGLTIVDYESISRCAISDNCELSLSPQMFSYIVYTSGSTGEPKGVICSHQTLLHHVRVLTNIYHICKEDKVSLMSSISGGALSTMALALLNGGALYPYDVQRSGVSELGSWLRLEQISIWFMPSPLFRNMAATVNTQNYFDNLRLIRLRSDKVHRSDIDLCKRIVPPNCVIATGLATTETGTIRMNLLDHETKILDNEVPVGFPVEDKEVFLIDDDGKEVRFNEVGEIAVRSKYLSPGYWNDPGLTKSKFQRDSENPDMRVYCTGDLGLMLPDGCLIHKGRKDFRVKIRGYGVDLVEVEKALLSHSEIQEAVVATRRTRSDEALLIAYYTLAGESAPTASDLRMYVQERLADYMIPSAFVKLDKIPLTANGKFDRRALPDPDDKRPALSTLYAVPTNEMEKSLVQIWEEVLNVRPIGIWDKFFDLGGHSLSATQVVSRVIKQFGLDISLQSLLQSSTVADMAAEITAHQGKTLDESQLAFILDEIESLSEAEAQRLVSKKN